MNKKHVIYGFGPFFLIMALLTGCGSSSSSDSDDDGDLVSVSGFVRAPSGSMLQDVEAYNNNGSLAVSDQNGLLTFDLKPEDADSVRLRKAGYTSQTVMLEVSDSETANFIATIRERNPAITVSADTVIDVTGHTGAKVIIPAGSLVDADGNPVTGNVQLNMTPVDVSDDDEAGAFPGAFAGTDINGNVAPVIMSYGTVEYFFSQNGEELNLADGVNATIEIPVFVTTHPDGSPIQEGDDGALWYLDEVTGMWLQENVGTIVSSVQSPTGLALSTTVSHFSWWNHDVAPETCDLTISTSGLPADANGNLNGGTRSPRLRTGSTVFTTSGTTVIMPRGTSVSLNANVTTSGGVYTASNTKTCNGAADALVMEFEGPSPVLISSFMGTVIPVFQKDTSGGPADGLWELAGNDVTFTWIVVNHTLLTLSSDQGHNTELGSPMGNVRFPLELDGSHVSDYVFTLTGSNDLGTSSESLAIQYDETPAPIIDQLSSFYNATQTTLYWRSTGADVVDVGYVETGGALVDATILDAGIFAEDGVTFVDNSAIPDNSELVIIFKNQYGSTSQRLPFSECPPDSMLTDAGICEILAAESAYDIRPLLMRSLTEINRARI